MKKFGLRRRAAVLATAAATILTAVVAAPKPAVATDPTPVFEAHGRVDVATGAQAPVKCNSPVGEPAAAVAVSPVTPGRIFSVTADSGPGQNDFDVFFYPSLLACQTGTAPAPRTNHAGDEHGPVPAGMGVAVVTLSIGVAPAAFTYRELPDFTAPIAKPAERAPTVIAVVEPRASAEDSADGISPYHWDWLGSAHPWNNDATTYDDIDFTADPATYLPGYPVSTPVQLTLPASASDSVSTLAAADTSKWSSMVGSTPANPRLYRFPGTKIVGSIRFTSADDSVKPGTANGSGSTLGGKLNTSHANQAASVAAGNTFGTCQECLVVIVLFDGSAGPAAEKWAASQPWIDVVTNSWEELGGLKPAYADASEAAVAAGQTVLWSSGNGTTTNGQGPNPTWTSAQRGPDWVVNVGSINPNDDQPMGSGRPSDVVSYGDRYPSAGGTTATGQGAFTGTSNATPVVAGTLATLLQRAKDMMGDEHTGHASGVVAKGKALPCASAAVTHCPLDDGVLTRNELVQVLYDTVQPTPPRAAYTGSPNTALSSAIFLDAAPFVSVAEGYGVVYGRYDSQRYRAEQRQLLDTLRGAASRGARAPGETSWMTVDSKCRQRLWGPFAGGEYQGVDPAFPGPMDAPAKVLNGLCDQIPQNAFRQLDPPTTTDELCVPGVKPGDPPYCPFAQPIRVTT
jgi:hypothetical protein